MPYNLDTHRGWSIVNPQADDLQHAVAAMDEDPGEGFVILAQTGMTYMQSAGDSATGFQLEYQEGSLARHFRARESLSAQAVKAALLDYLAGNSRWQSLYTWEKVVL